MPNSLTSLSDSNAPDPESSESPDKPDILPVTIIRQGKLAGFMRNLFGLEDENAHPNPEKDASGIVREKQADDEEKRLINNVRGLRHLTVDDVMVPRADIVAIPIDIDLPGFYARVLAKPLSRFPVYREELDDIAGYIHIKDVLVSLAAGREFDVAAMMREAMTVVPSRRVLDVLRDMRQRRNHLALVIDEFGGVDGLVTIEDLVESIVGEIEDEHERTSGNESMLRERPDGSVIADARVPIEIFEQRFGAVLTEEEREEIDTIGGLVIWLADKVPTRGETILHDSGIAFDVLDSDARRLKRIRIRKPE